MAGELLDAISSGDQVSEELIDSAESMIQAHQLYVSLLYVGMVMDRVTQLQYYFDALDEVVEEVDTKDLAEADPQTKLRAISVLNASIKSKIDVINSMMATRDAVGLLISSMKDHQFGPTTEIVEDTTAGKDLMARLQNMKPEQRQKVLGGMVSLLRGVMEDVDDE
jgi:hypothetical protein